VFLGQTLNNKCKNKPAKESIWVSSSGPADFTYLTISQQEDFA
jgi:hypothetical protein